MNKERRAELNEIYAKIEAILGDLQQVRDAEDDAYNNMPEGLQGSEKGEKMQELISNMDSAIGELESAKDNIENAKGEF